MPDWIENDLYISCDKEHANELKDFIDKVSWTEVVIPADKIESSYKETINDLNEWRDHIGKLVEAKKKTPLQYFLDIGMTQLKCGGLGEHTDFSLEKLCPMPKDLDVNIKSDARNVLEALEGDWGRAMGLVSREERYKIKSREDLLCFLLAEKKELVDLARTYRSNLKKYGHKNWHSWRIANWGTKWDVSEAEKKDEGEASVLYSFNSAWAAPIIWVEHVSKKYPNLKFKLEYRLESNAWNDSFYIHQNEEVVNTSY